MNIKQNRSDAATSKRKSTKAKSLSSLITKLQNKSITAAPIPQEQFEHRPPRQRIKGFVPVSEDFADAAITYEYEDKEQDQLACVMLKEVIARIMRHRYSGTFFNDPFYELVVQREVELIESKYDVQSNYPDDLPDDEP